MLALSLSFAVRQLMLSLYLKIMNEPFPEISTKELIENALSTDDEEKYWEYIRSLHIRGTKEVVDSAIKLCESDPIKSKVTGADILGQSGVPERSYPKEALSALRKLIKVENQNAEVLNAALVAIGHTQGPEDNEDLEIVRDLCTHESADVRLGVVSALWGHEDSESISTLISLTHDQDPNVRDWATTGIGSIIEVDSEEIRLALLDRLQNEKQSEEFDTYYEALMGLAVRKDSRASIEILKNLNQESPPTLVFEAAVEVGSLEFIKPMEAHLAHAEKEVDINESWIRELRESIQKIQEKNKI